MLSCGFKDQIYDIFQKLNGNTQVVCYSAFWCAWGDQKVHDGPHSDSCQEGRVDLEDICQFHINMEWEEWKLNTLCDLHEILTITLAVIFINTQREVDWLSKKRHAWDVTVSAMHGDMDPNGQDVIMKKFCSGSSRVLITTDLLTRGIDVEQVFLVINYDLLKTVTTESEGKTFWL